MRVVGGWKLHGLRWSVDLRAWYFGVRWEYDDDLHVGARVLTIWVCLVLPCFPIEVKLWRPTPIALPPSFSRRATDRLFNGDGLPPGERFDNLRRN